MIKNKALKPIEVIANGKSEWGKWKQSKQWQGLTDVEIKAGIDKIEDNKNVIVDRKTFIAGAYWAEKALRSKNT